MLSCPVMLPSTDWKVNTNRTFLPDFGRAILPRKPAMTSTAPAIILHTPQMGENIGAAARVMLNFGVTDLRIVTPRDGWPNPVAETMSAGAFEAGVEARVFDRTEDAVADLSFVAATTARRRDMEKPVYGSAEVIARIFQTEGKVGIMFGGERAGLPNDAVALADAILTYPVNTGFASLNLAQAVAVFCHAYGEVANRLPSEVVHEIAPASRDDLLGMIDQLVGELDRAAFFHPVGKRGQMIQNLTNAFTRAGWTEQEVRTFRGMIKAISREPRT